MRKVEGSVTVFLTFLFVLLFSLVGVTLDSARYFGSQGYMETAACTAQMALYGKYNKELFQEYQLFAYGGYDGIDSNDWLQYYETILGENLETKPEKKEGLQVFFQKNYASVYQIHNPSPVLSQVDYLVQEQEFLSQIDTWIKTAGLTGLTSSLLGKVSGNETEEPQNILEALQEKKDVDLEEDKEEEEKEMETEEGASSRKGEQEEENPIIFFQELVSHGILRLVCEEENLSDEKIEKREDIKEVEQDVEEPEWCQEEDGVAMLEGILGQSDSLWDEEMNVGIEKKGKLLLYASHMFQSYLEKGEKHAAYGLEYLVSGQTKEDDTMAYIVNRLFFIRTILDYAYVNQNPLFVEKSLATATEIAVSLCAEPFIPLIQQCILLILAVEEACVDVAALLQGRVVPLYKSADNFQMKYEEICLAGEGLFQKKAGAYPKRDNEQQLKGIENGFGYIHYLWLLMLMTSWENLYSRTLDLIQDDLRNRFNESFEMENCICGTQVKVGYEIPILSSVIWKNQKNRDEDWANHQGMLLQLITVQYGYQ